MIYTTRNWSNDTTEGQKERKDLFKCSFLVQQPKILGLIKTWSFKNLAILKCGNRTNPHAVQYK